MARYLRKGTTLPLQTKYKNMTHKHNGHPIHNTCIRSLVHFSMYHWI